MNSMSRVFYLEVGLRRWWLLLILLGVLLLALWPHYWVAVALTAKVVLMLAMCVAICTVSISEQGLVLYRVSRLSWPDITEAKARSFLGLPYVRISRASGMAWSVPLYLRSPQDFYSAVISAAPQDNPLRSFAEAAVHAQPTLPPDVLAAASRRQGRR
ncbi:hypothetical protein [Solimonas variicoloris]|uniref:hypothetical protein n=1 Tax=Solimonas variicoloris TaxID=254408 RepID=UPI0012B598FA|nr:hypothetical protein [Solimonas variicoloris]